MARCPTSGGHQAPSLAGGSATGTGRPLLGSDRGGTSSCSRPRISPTWSSPRSSPRRTRGTSCRSRSMRPPMRSLHRRRATSTAHASVIAVRERRALSGLANLGLRGPDAWVGGLGVVPAERRRGTGRRLDAGPPRERALARRRAQVWLEVIVENTGAIALYEELGYASFASSSSGRSPAQRAVWRPEVPAAEAHAWIRAHRVEREPWQRDDASLAQDRRAARPHGRRCRRRRPRVTARARLVVQVAGGEDAASSVLLAGARTPRRPPQRPQSARGRPGRGCARARSVRAPHVRQHEMVLRL